MPQKQLPEEYELIPHKELEEIREEIKAARAAEPEKALVLALKEVSAKIDKLLGIFEDAMRAIRIEEGGLTFEERMKPIVDKMNKILEQNSEIAAGIVALSDIVKELSEKVRAAPALPPALPLPPKLPPPPPALPPIPPPPKRP